jgi:hypothetical protein
VGSHDAACDTAYVVEWYCPGGVERGCDYYRYKDRCPQQDRIW